MLWMPVGYTVGYLVLLILVAAPLRRSGAYTLPDFAETRLYREVFAIADRKGSGKPVARARVPDIALESPKISRKLTTAWFAGRVEARWKHCMAR